MNTLPARDGRSLSVKVGGGGKRAENMEGMIGYWRLRLRFRNVLIWVQVEAEKGVEVSSTIMSVGIEADKVVDVNWMSKSVDGEVAKSVDANSVNLLFYEMEMQVWHGEGKEPQLPGSSFLYTSYLNGHSVLRQRQNSAQPCRRHEARCISVQPCHGINEVRFVTVVRKHSSNVTSMDLTKQFHGTNRWSSSWADKGVKSVRKNLRINGFSKAGITWLWCLLPRRANRSRLDSLYAKSNYSIKTTHALQSDHIHQSKSSDCALQPCSAVTGNFSRAKFTTKRARLNSHK